MIDAKARTEQVIAALHENQVMMNAGLEDTLRRVLEWTIESAQEDARQTTMLPALTATETEQQGNGRAAGQCELNVGTTHDSVVLDFGTTIRRIDLPPRQARALAEMLRQASHTVEKRSRA